MHPEDEAWTDWRARFSEVYDDANYSSPLQSAMMRASHRLVEKPFSADTVFARILEIGAGTGEHLPYVRHRFDEYTLTDIDPRALEAARRKLGDLPACKLRFESQPGGELGYASGTFDRVIATHVLEHIYQPHLALKEWQRVLRPGGVLSVLVPTDPGLAWRLGKHLGPRRNAIRKGIAYDYVMAREHVNACNGLVAILRHYFPEGREQWWPLVVPSMDLNLFVAFHAVIGKPGAQP
jgi:ubiquinone/menaquinone biosynthesis C-methylase UbiE